jgi:methyltransferase-like protein
MFQIDFDWWEESNLDLKTFLLSRLDVGDELSLDLEVDFVDLVDLETGEVRKVDGFQFALQTYFAQLPSDYIQQTSLVDAVFYTLLANANRPMSVREMANRVERDPDVVLKTISGRRIYQGIRPILNGGA